MTAALVLVFSVLILRMVLWIGDHRRERLWNHWRPLLAETACGELPSRQFPVLSQQNWLLFFHLWHHYQLNVRGEARIALQRLARRMGLHHIALRILIRSSNVREQIAAITALGWMRDVRAWELLLQRMHEKDPVLSFSSARSLVRIDPRSALRELMPLLPTRPDWSRHLVACLLLEAGPGLVARPLGEVLHNTPPAQMVVMVNYLRFADIDTATTVLLRCLPNAQDPELITACLKVAKSPQLLSFIRDRLQHPSWAVRVEAANAMSRLGDDKEIEILLPLLHDSQWWVRYRTAQAIAVLLHDDRDALEQLRVAQSDLFASDILAQVLAERTGK